jgi:hypothetical protein
MHTEFTVEHLGLSRILRSPDLLQADEVWVERLERRENSALAASPVRAEAPPDVPAHHAQSRPV